jgi:ABC-type nitrate/sulfonate/bicarbonate transport system ATPase subunit
MDNTTLAAELGPAPKPKKPLQAEALRLLHDMELTQCVDLYPEALSGGMKQRISLARVLLQGRPLLLLDEPFASLDVLLREQLYSLLRRLRNQHNLTVLLVTHDFRDALVLSDRVLLLAQGRIAQEWILPQRNREDPTSQGEWQQRLRESMKEHSVDSANVAS